MDNRASIKKNIPLVADAQDVELALKEHYLDRKGASLPIRDPANPPKRILMVDDDIFMCQLNCGILIHAGYEVDAAADGAAGLAALQGGHYDLLITDNSMPKVSGVDMVRMLRSRDTALPVILASGVAPTREMNLHPDLKINTILLKPYSIEELLAAVAGILRPINASQPGIAPPLENGPQP